MSESSATVTSSLRRMANITTRVATDVTSGKPPMSRFSIEYVDVHTVDGVTRVRLDVAIQPEQLQMLKETVAQAVDHSLAGVDLHLRAVDGQGLACQLTTTPAATSVTSRTSASSTRDGLQPSGKRLRNGPGENIIDDGFQQPGCSATSATSRNSRMATNAIRLRMAA